MAKQNVHQDILNFLDRNAVVVQGNNLDFADWENNLQKQLYKKNHKGIATLIASCIEIVLNYATNKTCKEQITSSRMYFNSLLPILQRLLKSTVLMKVIKLVLDTIIVENARFWCVKKELLKVFNNWLLKKELAIKNYVTEQLPSIYLYKLTDSICTNGDYDFQKTIIETIHGLYPNDILLPKRGSLIPESQELDKMFLNIHPETFNKDCRLFLNAMNKKNEEKIYSILCKYVEIGGTFSELPGVTKQALDSVEEGGLWVDFNLEDKAISWYYYEASLELVTLFASDINTYSWEIDESQMDEVKIHLKLKGDLVSSRPNDDSFVRQAKSVTIIAENNVLVQNLLSNILAKIFENVCSSKDKTSQNLDNYDITETKSVSKSYTVPSKSEVSTNYKFLLPTKKRKSTMSKNQDDVITIISSENSLEITSPKKIDLPLNNPPLTYLLKEKSQEPISNNYIKIFSNIVVESMKENVHYSQGSTILPEEVPDQAGLAPEETCDRISPSRRSNVDYEKFSKVLTESIHSASSKEKFQNVSNDMGNKNCWSESELAQHFESANEFIRIDSVRSDEILENSFSQLHENLSREFDQVTSTPKKITFSTEMYININNSQLTGNSHFTSGSTSLARKEGMLQDDATNEEIVKICENPKSRISENFASARESFYSSGSGKNIQDDTASETSSKPQEKSSSYYLPNENNKNSLTRESQFVRRSIYSTRIEATLPDVTPNEKIVNICENPKSGISENFESARESLYWSESEKTLQPTEASSKLQDKISTASHPIEKFQDSLTPDFQFPRLSIGLTRITEEILQDKTPNEEGMLQDDATNEEIVKICENPKSRISENFESAKESFYSSGSEKNIQDDTASETFSKPQEKSSSYYLPKENNKNSLTRKSQFVKGSIYSTRIETTLPDVTLNEEIVNTCENPKSRISENFESARESFYSSGSEKNIQDDTASETSSKPQEKSSSNYLPNEINKNSLTRKSQFVKGSIYSTRIETTLPDVTPNEEIVNTCKNPKSRISENFESARESLYWSESEKTLQATKSSSKLQDKISTASHPIEKFQNSLTPDFQFPRLSIGLTRITEEILQDKTPNEEGMLQDDATNEEIVKICENPKSRISENFESARESLYWSESEKTLQATKATSKLQNKINTAYHPIEKFQDSLTSDFQFPKLSTGLTRITEEILQDKTPNEETAKENSQDDAVSEVSTEPQDKISTPTIPKENHQDNLTSPNPNEFPSQHIYEELTQENDCSFAENEICSLIQTKAQEKTITENTKEKNSSILHQDIVEINKEQTGKRENINRAFVDISNFDAIETLENCKKRQKMKKTKNQKTPNTNAMDSIKPIKKPAPKREQKTTSKHSNKNIYDLIETVEEYEIRTRTEKRTRRDKSAPIFENNNNDKEFTVAETSNNSIENSAHNDFVTSESNLQANVRNVIRVIVDVHVPAAANEIEREETIRNDVENPNEEVTQTSTNNTSNERINYDEIQTLCEFEKRQQPVELEQINEACSIASTVFTKKSKRRKLYDPDTSFTEIKHYDETYIEEIKMNQFTSAKNQSKTKTVKNTTNKTTIKKAVTTKPIKKTATRKSGSKATRVTPEWENPDYNFKRKYLFKTKSTTKSRGKEIKGKETNKRNFDDVCPDTSNLKSSKKLRGARDPFHGTSNKTFGFHAKRIIKTLENGDNLIIMNEKCLAEKSLLYREIWNWSCKSYYKGKFVEIHSNGYLGKYLLILFYPLDFGKMPHCESPKEVLEINENYEKFCRLKTEVLCCSVDSVNTHKHLIECMEVNNLKFPLLEDPTHAISKAFSMYCSPYGHSYRGCFIINRHGDIVRCIQVDITSCIPLKEIIEGIRRVQANDC